MLQQRCDIKPLRHCYDSKAELPTPHNVMYTARGRALDPKEFALGFPQLPGGWGAELSSCAMALGTPSTCKCSRATKVTPVTRGSSWRSLGPGPSWGAGTECARGVVFSCTQSERCKPERLLKSLRLAFQNQERESKISWYRHTRGERNQPAAANPKKYLC